MTNKTVIADIRAIAAESGKNRHDQAGNAIFVCLINGINTGPAILDHLEEAGFVRKHAGIVLSANAGRSPNSSRWFRREDATYHAWTN